MSLPWVVYRIEDVLKMDNIDSSVYSPECPECYYDMEINFKGDGSFETFCGNGDCSLCHEVSTFTLEDLLNRKREDDHYDAVVDSLTENMNRPVCRIVNGTIFDGHHRLAACIDMGMRYIVAEQVAQPVYGDDFHQEFVYGGNGY